MSNTDSPLVLKFLGTQAHVTSASRTQGKEGEEGRPTRRDPRFVGKTPLSFVPRVTDAWESVVRPP